MVAVHGPALRCIRELMSLDAATLARDAQISTQYVWKIERGDAPYISRVLYVRLLTALHIRDWRVLLARPLPVAERQGARAKDGAA